MDKMSCKLEEKVEFVIFELKLVYKRIWYNFWYMFCDQRSEFLLFFGVLFVLWLVGYFYFSFVWIIMILMIFVGWEF